MPEITITIGPDGTIELDAEGFKGPVCEQELKEYLKVGSDAKVKKKAEYYQPKQTLAQKARTKQ